MKKLLLIIILVFVTLFSNGQTSVYHPFPDSDAVWNIQLSMYCSPIYSYGEQYSITITGDTLINSRTYHKLTIPNVVKSYNTTYCGNTTSGYRGAIRQDIANKKVFFVRPSDNLERLLYDFNMQVGDTVPWFEHIIKPDIVQSIDSVLVGGSYRKRWNINEQYRISFIEGIGSTYGLIKQSPGSGFIGYFPDLSITCYSQNGITLYPNSSADCQLITYVNSPDKIADQVKIFPNPSNGFLTIGFDNADIKEIRLTDLFGKTIFQQKKDNQAKIYIDNLKSGTYILTIIDKDNKITNRKIVNYP
jgi:hypothetical protein